MRKSHIRESFLVRGDGKQHNIEPIRRVEKMATMAGNELRPTRKNSNIIRIKGVLARQAVSSSLRLSVLKRKFNPFVIIGITAVVVFSILMPTLTVYFNHRTYQLSTSVKNLIGPANANLADKLSYDAQKHSYIFNKVGMDSAPTTSPTKDPKDPTAILKQLQAKIGGAGKKDKSLYSVELPKDASKGITYYDNNLGLNFSIVPQFRQNGGSKTDDRMVYPSDKGVKAVYTAKNNGIKEDLVLNSDPKSDRMVFAYKLKLPDTLEAKLRPDGSLGIFSADTTLYGNISYGTTKDQSVVEKARVLGEKTNLVFAIPAPTIKQSGKDSKGNAKADFKIEGDNLTVMIANLASIPPANYPISIDPSVVVTSTSDFQTGNNEGNIDFSVSGQIQRSVLTGGSTGVWSTTNGFTTARHDQKAVIYNGYIYQTGGTTGTNQNDVQYSPVSATGTVTAIPWTTGTSFSNIRSAHMTVAYNGYLYVIGGSNAPTYYNDVQFATLDPSTGAVGSWSTTSSFIGARDEFTGIAYQGYMYLLGGWNGSVNLSSVEYASINADGTLGKWGTTTAMATATANMVATAYNGYIYYSGGGDGIGPVAGVTYARLNSDGSIGSWVSTTAMPTARYSHGFFAYNGYLYVYGGVNGGVNRNDVTYAAIYADGSIGAWFTATNSFTTARRQFATAAGSGYIYILGGWDGTTNFADVQYAKLDQAGVLSSLQSATNVPATTRAWGAAAVHNGYIYYIGGCSAVNGDTCSTPVNKVEYAPISPDGVIGSWNLTFDQLPAARGMGSAAVFNNYIYYIAGRGSSTTVSNAVYYANINPDTLGPWTTLAPTGLTARYGQASVVFNDKLYVLGGCTTANGACTTFLNDAKYAVLADAGGFASNPGCVNNFCPTTAFSTVGRWGHQATIIGTTIYVGGGLHNGSNTLCNAVASTNCSDIWSATVAADGTIGAWSSNTSFTTARYGFTFNHSKGYMYISGGKTATSTFLTTTYYARITASGTLDTDAGCGSTWCSGSSLPTATSGAASGVYYNSLYYVGGQTAITTVVATTYSAAVNNGGLNTTQAWTTSPNSLPIARAGGGTVAYNGYLYYIAGNPAGTTTLYTKINADHSIGTWQYNTSLTTAQSGDTVSMYNGYLYLVCGYNGTTNTNTVQYSKINSDGTLGTWQISSNSYPLTLGNVVHVAYNGYLYGLGGSDNVATPYNNVYYAPLNAATGDVGSWTATTSFTNARDNANVAAYNGYMYFLGGGPQDAQVAVINANGTLGAWQYTSPPRGNGRYAFAMVVYNGYMYVLQGRNASLYIDDEQVAPILANGQLGYFETNPPALLPSNYDNRATAYDGYIYMTGGFNGASTTTQYAPVNSIPRTSNYSKVVKFASAQNTISGITFNGKLPGNYDSLRYQVAENDNVFGAPRAISSTGQGSGTCPTGINFGLSVRVSANIDDRGDAAAFPDIQNTSSQNLQDFTINYVANGHPFPDIRLRGGKSLQTGYLSPLDTCQ